MATIITDRTYTPEDLLKIPEGKRFELVNGQLLESHISGLAGWIAVLLSGRMLSFVLEHDLGIILPADAQFQCFPDDPNRIRKPDVAYIHKGRFVPHMLRSYIRVAPDIAAEVVSENDTYYEVEGKVREYLRAGVRLTWVLNPETQSIRIYRLNGSKDEIELGDVLSGEDVLAGFSVAVSDLFRLPKSDIELT